MIALVIADLQFLKSTKVYNTSIVRPRSTKTESSISCGPMRSNVSAHWPPSKSLQLRPSIPRTFSFGIFSISFRRPAVCARRSFHVNSTRSRVSTFCSRTLVGSTFPILTSLRFFNFVRQGSWSDGRFSKSSSTSRNKTINRGFYQIDNDPLKVSPIQRAFHSASCGKKGHLLVSMT